MRNLAGFLAATVLSLLVPPRASLQDAPRSETDEILRKTEKYRRIVTELRGLEFRRDVAVGMYSKAELLDFLKEEMDREMPREKALRFQRAYAKFGLIPPELDLYEAVMTLLGSSIAGFYHPRTKELRLIRPDGGKDPEAEQLKAMGIDMEAMTFVHELTHAAQDQNFELSTLPLDDETNDDLILALKSAIEGDASLVGWKFALKEMFDLQIGLINAGFKTGMLPGKAASLPAYLRLTLTFPYGHGSDFVLKCLRSSPGGLRDLSRLLRDFPLSSEQILHPSKYLEERDHPTLVTLSGVEKLFGPPWKEIVQNVHGEYGIKLILQEFKGPDLTLADIRRAHEGWDGDRYVVLEDDRHWAAYAWYSVWDTETDAAEFFKACAAALRRKYGHKTETPSTDGKIAFDTPEGLACLERKGADVLVLDGLPPALASRTAVLWGEAQKREMTGFERLRRFVCEKDGTREAFPGRCPRCGKELQYKDEKEPPRRTEKRKREY